MKPPPREGSAAGYRTRVLIIEGCRVFGELLAAALNGEQDLECAGLAMDLTAGVAEAVRKPPDVILAVDLHLRAGDRASVVPALAAACPSGRVVLLTSRVTGWGPEHVSGTGASVVLGDLADLAMVLAALREGRGGGDADPATVPRVDGGDSQDATVATLAPADLRLLRLVAAGYDSESAARELRVSPGSVRDRLRRICADLEADTPTEAVAIAVAGQVLSLRPEG